MLCSSSSRLPVKLLNLELKSDPTLFLRFEMMQLHGNRPGCKGPKRQMRKGRPVGVGRVAKVGASRL